MTNPDPSPATRLKRGNRVAGDPGAIRLILDRVAGKVTARPLYDEEDQPWIVLPDPEGWG